LIKSRIKHTIAIVIVYYHCYCGQKNGDNNASKILIDFIKKKQGIHLFQTLVGISFRKIGFP
jgi:hypothetical protein